MANDRVIVITGAARGIGLGLARHFAARGDAIVMNDSGVELDGGGGDATLVEREAASLRGQGGRAIASAASIADPATAPALAQAALSAFGRLDVWVNGAAIMRGRMIVNMTDDDWDPVVATGLGGTFHGLRAAA